MWKMGFTIGKMKNSLRKQKNSNTIDDTMKYSKCKDLIQMRTI